jgi:DNA invertase Pin-like site-specific DNA recombinase
MLAILGGLAAFERDLMRARTTEGRAHIATGGQGPQFLSKPTHVPAFRTAGVR